jgi:5-methylcytosine-specific restriction endonuclease McrA
MEHESKIELRPGKNGVPRIVIHGHGSRRPRISKSMRRRVFERDGYRCRKCPESADLTIDHVLPVVMGGTGAFENLQTLCRTCNQNKADTY